MIKIEKRLSELEDKTYYLYNEAKAMYNKLNHEEWARSRAENAYVKWLEFNNPDSIKYRYPNNPSDYEKFMFIEGYLASNKRRSG
jgi:hypothetical protein